MFVVLEVSRLAKSTVVRPQQPLSQDSVVFGRIPSSTAVTLLRLWAPAKSFFMSSMPVVTLVTVRPSKVSPTERALNLL